MQPDAEEQAAAGAWDGEGSRESWHHRFRNCFASLCKASPQVPLRTSGLSASSLANRRKPTREVLAAPGTLRYDPDRRNELQYGRMSLNHSIDEEPDQADFQWSRECLLESEDFQLRTTTDEGGIRERPPSACSAIGKRGKAYTHRGRHGEKAEEADILPLSGCSVERFPQS
jgi:hypothetical protein